MKRYVWMSLLFAGTLLMAEAQRAMIVFDASGSMWGQIDGKAKIEIARDALDGVVRTWNPEVELGLTVYGHRSKGDCNDIETVIPVGKVQSARILAAVEGIQPKGKTPISRSLRMAADALKNTEEKATVILISDGEETCDPDPCGTAKALEKEGVDFVAHVIGFNVDQKTDAELECIASATGGEYFSVNNASALNNAMKTIAKKVEEPKPEPKPEVKTPENPLEITASETEGGKWVDTHYMIYNAETGRYITSCDSYKDRACLKPLPVGKYLLKATYNEFKQEQNFEIKPGETLKIHVVMGQTGEVEITASETEGGKWIDTHYMIYKVETKKYINSCSSYKDRACLKQLPVGKYLLKSTYNEFKQEQSFEIRSGETLKIHVVMGQTGEVEITASENEGGKWIDTHYMIYNAETNKYITSCSSYKDRTGVKQLPVGKYLLKSTYGDSKREQIFEIVSGETTRLHIVFPPLQIAARCADPKAKVEHEIYAADGKRVYRKRESCDKAVKLSLPEGNYTIESKVDRFKKEMNFTISKSSPDHLEIDLTPTVE